jgi:hypothetical protein
MMAQVAENLLWRAEKGLTTNGWQGIIPTRLAESKRGRNIEKIGD